MNRFNTPGNTDWMPDFEDPDQRHYDTNHNPAQVRDLLRENAEMRAIIYEVSTGGYTPMQAHEWLKSHPENAKTEGPAA